MPKNKHLRSIYSLWKIKELTDKMCLAIEKKNIETKKVIDAIQKDALEMKKLEDKIKREIKIKDEQVKEKENTDWNYVMGKMIERENEICAICFCSFAKKSLFLLDCTHCFHKNCLESFEKFDVYYENRCPICRRNYKKKELTQ